MPIFGSPDVPKLEAKADIPALIKALDYQKDPAVCRAAAQALGRLRAPQAVDALLAALAHIPAAAASALGAIGDRRAVPALIEMLSYHRDPAARLAAAEALGSLKDPRAVAPLVQIMMGGLNMFPDLYQRAEQSLVQMGAAAVDPILALFNGAPHNTKFRLAMVLRDMGWAPDDHSPAAAWYWMVQSKWEQCLAVGAPAEEALLYALNEFSLAGALNVVAALGRAKSSLALQILCAALEGENPEVRTAAADALVGFGPAAVEPLLAVLNGNKTPARAKAAGVLGKLGDARALPVLKKYADDKAVSVRAAVTQALAGLGGVDAVDGMLQALGDANKEARKAAGNGLLRLLDAALPRLIPLLGDANPLVRSEVTRVLVDAGWQPQADDSGAWYYINRKMWDQCLNVGEPAVQPLLRVLGDETADEHSRAEAARVLGELGSPSAVDGLCTALNSYQRTVRLNAAAALGQLKQPAALDALIPLLPRLDDGIGSNPRRTSSGAAAARAVAEIGGDRAVDALLAVLQGSAPGDRVLAAEGLGKIADPRAAAPLTAALQDVPYPDVRAAAAYALIEIGRGKGAACSAYAPLVAVVQDGLAPAKVRGYAVLALGAAGDPGCRTLLEGLVYEGEGIGVAAVQALGELGQPESMPVLLPFLNERSTTLRRVAADALVKLYRTGRLSGEQKQTLLNLRDAITLAHTDTHTDISHDDQPDGCYVSGLETHTDSGHTDHGIGVDFPL